MLSREQASAMLSLQAEMNHRIDPGWVAAAYPYLRAVIVEGAEAIEHHGWKWWKKQERDNAQLQMELVDIWHFLLSEVLLREEGDQERALVALMRLLDSQTAAEEIEFDGGAWHLDRLNLLEKLELLIGLCATRRVNLAVFGSILLDCDMSWLDLYRQYIGKNVLNTFRQDHGYKEGHYRKVWSGREDNEFLAEILATSDPEQPGYREFIYSELAQRYPG